MWFKCAALSGEIDPIRNKLPCDSEYGCLIIGLGRTRSELNRGANMPHAIVIGANGRRHEVDFENAEVTIEVFSGFDTASPAPHSCEKLLLLARGRLQAFGGFLIGSWRRKATPNGNGFPRICLAGRVCYQWLILHGFCHKNQAIPLRTMIRSKL